MSIIGRISQLFKADVHSILDAIEDPETVLTQSLREMHEGIAQDEKRLVHLSQERTSIDTRCTELKKGIAETILQVELCIRKSNETLARSVIRRRLELERFLSLLERRADELQRLMKATESLLIERRERLAALKEKATLFQSSSAALSPSAEKPPSPTVSESEIEVMLLAERERVLGASSSTIQSANE